jgi:class 3 adenylate cyclase
MQRRGKSTQSVKGQRALRLKARKASNRSTADLQEQVAALTRELREAREQQAATSEVLNIISSSAGELQPVFDTIVERVARLCDALYSVIWLYDGNLLHYAGSHNFTPEVLEQILKTFPKRPDRSLSAGRAVLDGRISHIPDLLADHAYAHDLALAGNWRASLGVPLLHHGKPVGAISLGKMEATPFSERQIQLITTFAAQAVIAIENTRLLNELRQRTDDLSESLEQQTATSEVLKIISSSPGELEPVFMAMLENAVRICEAKFGTMFLREGDAFRTVALHNAPPAYAELRRRNPIVHPHPKSGLGRLVATRQVVHIADILEDQGYLAGAPISVAIFETAGARTILVVPMLKDNEVVGTILIYRQQVRPFTDKQIELVKNFAAQAVIAIENTRLLDDLNKLNQQLEQRVTDQITEIERMGRLRRFLPPQVADLIVASGTEKQLESHRREITALFCDLRGFTGFSESSDPEDVMALLREYHAAIGEIINTYGGTLERYAGDGVMVVFNDPIPVDNPALQAALMAIDMRAAIGALIEKWRKLGHEIGFGIGIAHGFATLGTIGFEGRFDYAAIGTVSNVASRLCDEAKPGQILISPRVLMAVEDAVSVEPVGEFKLKGISRPLAAYNVLSAVSPKI